MTTPSGLSRCRLRLDADPPQFARERLAPALKVRRPGCQSLAIRANGTNRDMDMRMPTIIVADEKPVVVAKRRARPASRGVMHLIGWRALRHGENDPDRLRGAWAMSATFSQDVRSQPIVMQCA